MTPEKQKIIIAELAGWRLIKKPRRTFELRSKYGLLIACGGEAFITAFIRALGHQWEGEK